MPLVSSQDTLLLMALNEDWSKAIRVYPVRLVAMLVNHWLRSAAFVPPMRLPRLVRMVTPAATFGSLAVPEGEVPR